MTYENRSEGYKEFLRDQKPKQVGSDKQKDNVQPEQKEEEAKVNDQE